MNDRVKISNVRLDRNLTEKRLGVPINQIARIILWNGNREDIVDIHEVIGRYLFSYFNDHRKDFAGFICDIELMDESAFNTIEDGRLVVTHA